ncbi:protein suppressor of variegation 3-7 isoform X2 [Drosophila hydei]|uniref:Protein suppressor of variegation 3-7 isoform X2 n=1 Tax=Drosophila hydei TaxID=7224 RepID=A0A6J1M8K3_DROHY|nr:protein suppressor of variegation 3-7 isoform X2 [Drosophila hydei]
MDSETGQIPENCLTTAGDAGNANKMASSSSINKSNSEKHELKIMEVEGAMSTEATLIIELDDDDVDDITVPVCELQTANIDNAQDEKSEDPLLDEKASTKTEPSSDGESNGSYNGPDPMGLLERIDSGKEIDDEYDDDEESVDEASSSGSRRRSLSERWQIWMKRYPWLLHEERDGEYAFCLYCNVVININRNQNYIQQHNLSLYHQERENNYLAFKNSDEYKRSGLDDQEIKHEFGTDSYVAAVKQKRANEVEKLNNFNWQRWLDWHQWLERIQNEGTIGLCKYCNVRMNVEFLYLRKRHETSKGHCEAQRTQEKRKRKRSVSQSENPMDTSHEVKEIDKASGEETIVMTIVGGGGESTDPSDWCELLPETNPQQCRCTLCECRMAITSFMRHLKTKVHCNNLMAFKQTQLSKMNRGIWSQYAEQHPWIVADPNDPTMAYCHVCSRRFIYGHSEIKRKNHENSEKHQAAMAAMAATVAAASEAVKGDVGEHSEAEQTDAQTEGSDDDYIQQDDKLSTSPKSSAEPTEETESQKAQDVVRHFSWLRYSKDRKIQICKFCRVRFHNDSSKVRHEQSVRHKKLANQFKARQAQRRKEARELRKIEEENDNEDQSNADSLPATAEDSKSISLSKGSCKTSPKPAFKPVPATMQGKVMLWKDRFPWLSYKRNESRHNYGWCKLCEVSVFLPSFKYASKHQRSSRHIRLRFERKRVARMLPTDAMVSASTSSSPLATGEAKHKAAMAELQAKYDWLEPDANDENYCYCKLCETRLPIKIFFLRQHDGSRKHLEHLERLRNSGEITTVTANDAGRTASIMDVDPESDDLSIKSECSNGEQPPSKRMRRSLEVRRILRALRDSVGKRNDERSQLDMAKDMICSSFDIVSRLRTLERENESAKEANTSSHNCSLSNVSVTQPRDTMELFFESITQTMKGLPGDLAAEGKAKIMQIVCDLELRGIQRNASVLAEAGPAKETRAECMPTQSESRRDSVRFSLEDGPLDRPPDSSESLSQFVAIDDLLDEQSARSKQPLSNSNHSASNQAEPNQNSTIGGHTKATATNINVPTSASSNGRGQDTGVVNVRCYLSSSKADDSLRVVPINKLTTANANYNSSNRNGSNQFNPLTQKSNHVTANAAVMNTPPSSNSELSNGSATSTPMYRRIRINNGANTKVLEFQKIGQEHQLRLQKSMQQQNLQNKPRNPNSAASTPLKSQDQAQRTLPVNRSVVQHNRSPHTDNT